MGRAAEFTSNFPKVELLSLYGAECIIIGFTSCIYSAIRETYVVVITVYVSKEVG